MLIVNYKNVKTVILHDGFVRIKVNLITLLFLYLCLEFNKYKIIMINTTFEVLRDELIEEGYIEDVLNYFLNLYNNINQFFENINENNN